VARGERAKSLLNDELLVAAFDATRARCIAAWESASTVEQRESFHARVLAVADIRKELLRIVNDGTHAAQQVKTTEKREAKSHRA
jgi:hypothetical protein